MSKVYEIITERILAQLDAGTVPWRKPWKVPGGAGGGLGPMNLKTGKAYRGINVWLLGTLGYGSPYWMSYKQAKALGGHVKRGEKGSTAIFWKVGAEQEVTDPDTGKVSIRRPFMLRYYNVFNLEQTEGVRVPKGRPMPTAPADPADDETEPDAPEFDPVAAAEAIFAGMQSPPSFATGGGRAYYRPSADHVQMPPRETFSGPPEYYSTLFHELGHSTGHQSRLDRAELRDFAAFGDHNYSREELTAEFTAAYLTGEAGLFHHVEQNSAAYIDNWRKALRSDPKAVVLAAARAQRAADYILGREWGAKPDAPQETAEAA